MPVKLMVFPPKGEWVVWPVATAVPLTVTVQPVGPVPDFWSSKVRDERSRLKPEFAVTVNSQNLVPSVTFQPVPLMADPLDGLPVTNEIEVAGFRLKLDAVAFGSTEVGLDEPESK